MNDSEKTYVYVVVFEGMGRDLSYAYSSKQEALDLIKSKILENISEAQEYLNYPDNNWTAERIEKEKNIIIEVQECFDYKFDKISSRSTHYPIEEHNIYLAMKSQNKHCLNSFRTYLFLAEDFTKK